MWNALWPPVVVFTSLSIASQIILRYVFHVHLNMGASVILGVAWGVASWPWLFKRIRAALDRGEV